MLFKKLLFWGLLKAYKFLLFSWDPINSPRYHQPISSLFLYPILLTRNTFLWTARAEGNRILSFLVSNTLGLPLWVMVKFSVPDMNIKMEYISEIKILIRSTSHVHSTITMSLEHLKWRMNCFQIKHYLITQCRT